MKTKLYRLLLCLIMANMLGSCTCSTSVALSDTCDFVAVEQEDSRYDVYRLAGQYYLLCEVTYICEFDKLKYASLLEAHDHFQDYYLPISVNRTSGPERYYARLSPEAAKGLLGVTVAPAPEGTPHCIPEQDWDAAAAEKIASKVKLTQVWVLSGDEACCWYDDDEPRCCVYVPQYKPWDYWVKMPLCGLLLVGVDVPCTVVGSIGVLAGAVIGDALD